MRRSVIHVLVLSLFATSFSACGGSDDAGERYTGASDTSTPAPSPSPSPPGGEPGSGTADGTPIRITFGDTQLAGILDDNAPARDLAGQLPLTLTFRDHDNAGKTAPLPRELSVDGAPDGHDPVAGDIGYRAPDGDLVFYYDDAAPFLDGIVRIGEFRGHPGALARQGDDLSITVDRAR